MFMATTRSATSVWHGTLLEGSGVVTFNASGLGSHPVSWPARSGEPEGVTSPEELIAAAHASCFSMALSSGLAKAGHPAESLTTTAEVDFQPGEGITAIRLLVQGTVPGLSSDEFATFATTAKENCPVSKALGAVPISLHLS
jgi:osmotically inducible protein OsmC